MYLSHKQYMTMWGSSICSDHVFLWAIVVRVFFPWTLLYPMISKDVVGDNRKFIFLWVSFTDSLQSSSGERNFFLLIHYKNVFPRVLRNRKIFILCNLWIRFHWYIGYMISCLIVAHLSGAPINITFRFCTSVGLTFRNQKLFTQRTAKNYPIVSEFKSRQGIWNIFLWNLYIWMYIYTNI